MKHQVQSSRVPWSSVSANHFAYITSIFNLPEFRGSSKYHIKLFQAEATDSARSWSPQSGLTSAGSHARQEREFFRRDWWFVGRKGKSQSQTLAADNYEWAFEDIIPGNMQESVEGLAHSWVIYRMKATIERPGMLQKALHDRKHVRVIRTYDPNADEVANAMVSSYTEPQGHFRS